MPILNVIGYRLFYKPGQVGAAKILLHGTPNWMDLGPYSDVQMAVVSNLLNGTGQIAYNTDNGLFIIGKNPPAPSGGTFDLIDPGSLSSAF